MKKRLANLVIGGRRYDVLEDSGMDAATLGMSDTVNAKIYLAPDCDFKVIVHELVHAFTYEEGFYSVKLSREVMADFFATFGGDIMTDAYAVKRCRFLNKCFVESTGDRRFVSGMNASQKGANYGNTK